MSLVSRGKVWAGGIRLGVVVSKMIFKARKLNELPKESLWIAKICSFCYTYKQVNLYDSHLSIYVQKAPEHLDDFLYSCIPMMQILNLFTVHLYLRTSRIILYLQLS